MFLTPFDAAFGGVLRDTARRDTLQGGDGPDVFALGNDGRTDNVWGLEDGVDVIDIAAWDATWAKISVRQISLTEYVVDYQNEERIRITYQAPPAAEIPEDGMLLTADDFIFANGVPAPSVQLRPEASATEKEVIFGTSLPDVFLFEYDGQRDTVRRFEPGKDLIDLADYGTSFGALIVTERKEGRLSIKIPVPDAERDLPPDWLVLIDNSHQLTADDLTADMFIF